MPAPAQVLMQHTYELRVCSKCHLSALKHASQILFSDEVQASLCRSPPERVALRERVRPAGAAILPPNALKALDSAACKAVAGSSAAVVFATGGERGAVKLWRSDTGQCILEQRRAPLLGSGRTEKPDCSASARSQQSLTIAQHWPHWSIYYIP